MRSFHSRSREALLLLVPLAFACGYGNGGYGGVYGGGGMPASCPPGTQVVTVGAGPYGMSFSPAVMSIRVNDTVCWTWLDGPHSVVSGAPCIADNLFCSPADTGCGVAPGGGLGSLYLHKFTTAGTFRYFCGFHCAMGMVGSVTVAP